MSLGVILSLFPGIGLLDRAFEEAGFCVVRGPDALWGGDVMTFHPPAGRFDGVVGGPPCQCHSQFAALRRATGGRIAVDLIPEFRRVVHEAAPGWFLMENVPGAPSPGCEGYGESAFLLNNRWFGGVSARRRRFVFGVRGGTYELGRHMSAFALESPDWLPAALASGGVKPGLERKRGRRLMKEYGYCTAYTFRVHLEAQGLPAGFLEDAPFTMEGKHRVVGNGVPLPLGRAVANAVADYVRSMKECLQP